MYHLCTWSDAIVYAKCMTVYLSESCWKHDDSMM